MLDLWHQISLGDVQSNYLLTTAENELGVVVAHSESGNSQCSIKRGFLCFYVKLQTTGFQHTGSTLSEHKVVPE